MATFRVHRTGKDSLYILIFSIDGLMTLGHARQTSGRPDCVSAFIDGSAMRTSSWLAFCEPRWDGNVPFVRTVDDHKMYG